MPGFFVPKHDCSTIYHRTSPPIFEFRPTSITPLADIRHILNKMSALVVAALQGHL